MEFLLTLSVIILIFLNGATDASNAIASSVSSGALSMRKAARVSAVCNTAGGCTGILFFSEIRDAVTENAHFGAHPQAGVLAVLLSAVSFTAIAWLLRLPTSESHSLLSAAAGASLVLSGRSASSLLLPVFWMACSVAAGVCSVLLLHRLLPHRLRRQTVRRLQILCAAAASFLHGLQDLGKFLALLCSAVDAPLPLPALMLTSSVLGLGTLCGGRRMTEAVGAELADLDASDALKADLSSAAALFFLSAAGIPSSTTHTRTAAASTAASISRGGCLHIRTLLRFISAWILTFPICTGLGAFFTQLLLRLV